MSELGGVMQKLSLGRGMVVVLKLNWRNDTEEGFACSGLVDISPRML